MTTRRSTEHHALGEKKQPSSTTHSTGRTRFITLMLPHEIRPFYGIGEMAYEAATGGMRRQNLFAEGHQANDNDATNRSYEWIGLVDP